MGALPYLFLPLSHNPGRLGIQNTAGTVEMRGDAAPLPTRLGWHAGILNRPIFHLSPPTDLMGQWVINYYWEKRARFSRKSFSFPRSHLIFIRPLISLSQNKIFAGLNDLVAVCRRKMLKEDKI